MTDLETPAGQTPGSNDSGSPDSVRRGGSLREGLRRWVPAARLTWLSLVVLAAYGTWYLKGVGIASVVVFVPVAVTLDLALQRARFAAVRFPDAAIATALFVVLLLPPTVSSVAGAAAVVIAIAGRHLLRSGGRPWFNPAATGVLAGVFLFGLAPAWWIAVGTRGEILMAGLGVVLLARTPRNWRLPVTFLLAFGFLTIVEHLAFGASVSGRVLLLGTLDPVALFLALYMVPEPRTAPSAPSSQPLYAGTIALAAVFLPVFLPTTGVFVALIAGNTLSVALRHLRTANARTDSSPVVGPAPRGGARRRRKTSPNPNWTIPTRVGTGLLVLAVVGIIVAGVQVPRQTPSVILQAPPSTSGGSGAGSTGGAGAASCASDSPTVSSADLQMLHQALGPSVVLSYQPNTGTTVFYDPVNQVTVTETDLYEDYGYAEFNGDDYAVSGCVPP